MAAVEDAVQRMLAQQDLARFVYSLPVRHSALLRPEVPHHTPCSCKSPTCSSGGCAGARSATTSPSTSSPATSSRPWRRRCATGPRARVEDPMAHLRIMLALSFHGVTSA